MRLLLTVSRTGTPGTLAEDPLRTLAHRAKDGDLAAERTLLVAVTPAMLSIARRVLGAHHQDVEDVCQESAMGLLAALSGFRAECSVIHFACRIALNTALSHRRRRGYRQNADSDEPHVADGLVDAAPSPAERLEGVRRQLALRELLDRLPISQAEVLALHVALGHTVEETASIVDVPVNTVRTRLRRGLAALRERLERSPKTRDLIASGHG